jgi:hypothetical protein
MPNAPSVLARTAERTVCSAKRPSATPATVNGISASCSLQATRSRFFTPWLSEPTSSSDTHQRDDAGDRE